jgi:hypothetical protein
LETRVCTATAAMGNVMLPTVAGGLPTSYEPTSYVFPLRLRFFSVRGNPATSFIIDNMNRAPYHLQGDPSPFEAVQRTIAELG